ncbi:hypothetical protein HOC13_00250 [Candidatus Woesearchaeota archaeon]|nr:hypothetical protein [Candidatus Woesearchaeota archaeon]
MKEIYQKIWELAKPYYEKGRPMDVDHIEWMIEDALLVCQKENLEDSLLLPLVILHDVGYAEVPKDNPYNLDLRKAHMDAGAKIAKKILEKVDYPANKVEKIVYYVSVHDNWALGDKSVYENNPILAVFSELDFIWMATPKGFAAIMEMLNKNKQEMFEYVRSRPEEEKILFSTKTTKRLYESYLNGRKKELN